MSLIEDQEIPAETQDILNRCAQDDELAMRTFLKIYDKNGHLVPFQMFEQHKKFEQYAKPMAIVIKGRQVYFTSYIEARSYYRCNTRTGYKAVFLNLDVKKTEIVFERAKVMHKHYPAIVKRPLKKDTGMAMVFDGNGCEFHAMTCNNDSGADKSRELGRSITAHDLHISEAPYIKNLKEILEGFLDSIPDGDSASITLEGTGNGAQGECYERAEMIKNSGDEVAPDVWHYGEMSLHFIPWFVHYEYRMDHNPFNKVIIKPDSMRLWVEDEQHHIEAMQKYNYGPDEIERAMNWRRWRAINRRKLEKDPVGCVNTMNQEHPATYKDAFQFTGSAFLSLTQTEQQRGKWRDFNYSGEYAPMPMVGRFLRSDKDKIEFVGDESGDIQIWFPPVGEWKDRYLVHADCGHGLPDGDRDYIAVKDRVAGVTCAVAHGTFGAKKSADIMRCFGYFYGGKNAPAMIAWEINDPGQGVCIYLRQWDYPNLFANNDRREYDIDFGWRTDAKTRPMMLELLKNRYEDELNPHNVPYLEFYTEAAAFRMPPGKDKPEGVGEHDDCIMGEAVGVAVDAIMSKPKKVRIQRSYEPGTVGYEMQKLNDRTQSDTPLSMRNY